MSRHRSGGTDRERSVELSCPRPTRGRSRAPSCSDVTVEHHDDEYLGPLAFAQSFDGGLAYQTLQRVEHVVEDAGWATAAADAGQAHLDTPVVCADSDSAVGLLDVVAGGVVGRVISPKAIAHFTEQEELGKMSRPEGLKQRIRSRAGNGSLELQGSSLVGTYREIFATRMRSFDPEVCKNICKLWGLGDVVVPHRLVTTTRHQ